MGCEGLNCNMETRRIRGSRDQSPSSYLKRKTPHKSKCPELAMYISWCGKSSKLKSLTVILFMGLPFLILLPLILTNSSASFQQEIEPSILAVSVAGKSTDSITKSKPDETLGGLLLAPETFKDNRCISRSQEYLLRRPSPYRPSPHLTSRLREYEDRHHKCAEEAAKFSPMSNATEQDFGGCQFVVWMTSSGLGNRIMSLVSAFVYALVTDRVLLIDQTKNIDGLFCEPFPNASWLLPETFPNEWMDALNRNSSCRFGSMALNPTFTLSHNGYAYLDLMHHYNVNDKKFFCANCQVYLRSFPWLFLQSNMYFVPGLHLVPEFHAELDKLFPERGTVFHHIGRYLLHPSDSVWGLVSHFYNTNLASAQHKVGLQIRVFSPNALFPTISNSILSCVLENKLLPNVTLSQDHNYHGINIDKNKSNSIAVLVASLHEVFYETMSQFYQDHPTLDGGQLVGVYTASQEKGQSFMSLDHDKKALADMFLLSFSDTLVTSSWSTFGYVAQGLAGRNPWILPKLDNVSTAVEVLQEKGPCNRGVSFEPCFHIPPLLDCEYRGWGSDPSKILPCIQQCEDVVWGIKIMDGEVAAPS